MNTKAKTPISIDDAVAGVKLCNNGYWFRSCMEVHEIAGADAAVEAGKLVKRDMMGAFGRLMPAYFVAGAR